MKKNEPLDFFNPAVTADVAVIKNYHSKDGDGKPRQEVLLIQRREDPCKGMWAFPGGHMDSTDSCIEDAARRELKEETGIVAKYLRPVGVLSKQDRMDAPCMCHVFCYSFWVDGEDGIGEVKAKAADDAANATWFGIDTAFDRKNNTLWLTLSPKTGSQKKISFSARFSISPFGYAESKVEYEKDAGDDARLAFDHANMLSKALMSLPGFMNIGVAD